MLLLLIILAGLHMNADGGNPEHGRAKVEPKETRSGRRLGMCTDRIFLIVHILVFENAAGLAGRRCMTRDGLLDEP